MGSCTRRHFLLSICLLQLLTIIERQVFDFLGYMWAPIAANFFHIIFVIFGFFGAYQFRAKYIITYSIWNFLWIGWNVFLICFYLSVGILDKNSDILNLGTGSVSWFEVNGFGCKPIYSTNITSEDPFRPVRPETVENCLLDYPYIEITHSGIQLMLSVFGLFGAIFIAKLFLDDEDDRSSRGSKKSKHRQSLYSIEFSPPVDTIRGRHDDFLDYDDTTDRRGAPLSPKPMTPRRVKRRSVMTRGTTNRQSTTSRRSSNHHGTSNRNSVRASRRKYQQNPVTKLMETQQHQAATATANSSGSTTNIPLKKPYPPYVENSQLTETNLKYLNKDLNTAGNGGGSSMKSYQNNSNFNSFQQNIIPDPIYYNMSASTTLLQQTSTGNSNNQTAHQGHYNPTYQHSMTNLNTSPESVNTDELYNNRPPSVRSSYSNFHGARHLSSYNPSPDTENVFVGLTSQQQHQQQQHQLMIQQQQQQHQQQSQPQAIPQVPQRRSGSRESVRSMAFLNNGPPAYNLNYHTPPESETTM